MRVLFVLKQIDYEPVGLMQMSAVLKAAGHEVRLAVVASEDVEQVVRDWQPGILAYSVWTGGHQYYVGLNRKLRQHVDAFSAFGGPHATFFPEMIDEDPLIDGICIGEGEGAILDLANALDVGEFSPGQLCLGQFWPDIANWHFQINGEIVRNPVRPAIADLDDLPMADRKMIYDKDPFNAQSPIKHFITGRGCPYDCTYCFNRAWADIYSGDGRRVRQRSVDLVLDDIEYVRQHWPLGFVVFLDDTFTVKKNWIAEFVEKYPQRIGLPFFCNVRANLVKPQLVEQLRQAGCASVGMGLETADDKLRNDILKRNMSRAQIVEACSMLRAAGIGVLTTNMLGLPGGSLEMDIETLKLNAECRPAFANAFLFQPYPRTELGEYAASLGLVDGDINAIGLSAWNTSILKFPPEEKHQMENLQKLFAITVEYPRLLPLTRRLLKWPHNRVFWLIHKLWKGYTIKSRIHPVRLTWRDYLAVIRRFMNLE